MGTDKEEVRKPVEDIVKGASNTDQIDRMKKNAEASGKSEETIGSPPASDVNSGDKSENNNAE